MKIGPLRITPRRKRKRFVNVGPVRVRYPRTIGKVLDLFDLLRPPQREESK